MSEQRNFYDNRKIKKLENVQNVGLGKRALKPGETLSKMAY